MQLGNAVPPDWAEIIMSPKTIQIYGLKKKTKKLQVV